MVKETSKYSENKIDHRKYPQSNNTHMGYKWWKERIGNEYQNLSEGWGLNKVEEDTQKLWIDWKDLEWPKYRD